MELGPDMTDDDCIRSKLQKLVECPVCYETMSATEMCVNGHTVCSRCRGQLSVCPLCSKTFGNIRNLLAEGISELLSFRRCNNFGKGCGKFLPEKECEKHESGCIFRSYACKICKDDLCFMELKDHFQKKHANSIIEPYSTKELKLEESTEGAVYFCLIEFNNDLFWFWRKHTRVHVFFGLQYCGDKEKVSSYKYNLQVVSKSDDTDLEFSGPVLQDVKESNRYSPQDDYVALSKSFLGEGAKYQVSVAKV